MALSPYVLLPIAVLIDFLVWGLTQTPIGCFSQALLYVLICAHAPFIALFLALFVALWYRFILTGVMGVDLLVIIPFGLGYYYAFSVAAMAKPFIAAAVFLGLVVQQLVFDVADPVRVFLSFISSVIMVYLVLGSQGNRLSY
jgi:hypothetical protein